MCRGGVCVAGGEREIGDGGAGGDDIGVFVGGGEWVLGFLRGGRRGAGREREWVERGEDWKERGNEGMEGGRAEEICLG